MEAAQVVGLMNLSFMWILFLVVAILTTIDSFIYGEGDVAIKANSQSKKWEKFLKCIIIISLVCLYFILIYENISIRVFMNTLFTSITVICGFIVLIEIFSRYLNKPLTDSLSHKEFAAIKYLVYFYVLFIQSLVENGLVTIIDWCYWNIPQYVDWIIIAVFISFYAFVFFVILSNLMIAARRLLEAYILKRTKSYTVANTKPKPVSFEEDEDFKELKMLGKFRINKFHLYCFALFFDVILYIIVIVFKIFGSLKILLISNLGILKRIVVGFGNRILRKTDVELLNLSMYYALIISILTSYYIISQNNIIDKTSLDQYSFLTSVIIIPLVIIKISNLKTKKMIEES